MSGRASRSLRSRRTRNSSFGIARSGPHGVTVSAQLAPGPLWESSSVRDAESKSKKASRTRACQQRLRHRAANPVWFARGGSSSSAGPAGLAPCASIAQVGTWNPCARSTPGPSVFCRARSNSASVPGWLSRRAGTKSAQEAQYAACRCALADDRPSPPCAMAAAHGASLRPKDEQARHPPTARLPDTTRLLRHVMRSGEDVRGAGRHRAQTGTWTWARRRGGA